MLGKYFIMTFGCQMNVHESEKMAGILAEKGYAETREQSEADIIVYNTCCVRDTAEKKILGNIGELKRLKRERPDLIVAVVGCMSQQRGAKELLRQKFPYIDIILGASNLWELGGAIDKTLSERRFFCSVPSDESPEIKEDCPAFRSSGTNAWVNIMYGCNNFCTYCVVPYVRGRERSRRPEAILGEVNALLDDGYKEITLLGQNVDSYRADGGYGFVNLLESIAKINGKFRLRFMSSHPKDFNEEIVGVIRGAPNICNNIHLPVQSGSNRILRLMNRKYTRERYLELINCIKTLPDAGITTDIMAGFPTESDDDFEQSLSLLREVRYSGAFTFVFSPRKGTAAAAMAQLDPAVKKERIKRLVALQNDIAAQISRDYVGKNVEILVEDINPKHADTVCGRTESGRLVSFNGEKRLIGSFVNVKITKAKSAALWGEINGKDNRGEGLI